MSVPIVTVRLRYAVRRASGAFRTYSAVAAEKLKSMHVKSFWNDRYSRGTGNSFEWFGGYGVSGDFLTSTIRSVIKNQSSVNACPVYILDVGCGTSALVPDLIRNFDESEGFLTAVAIDFSNVATSQMLKKHRDLCKAGRLHLCDVDLLQPLPFIESSFDVVVDKGTLDAVLHGFTQSESSTSKTERDAMLQRVLTGIDRVVKPGGALFMVTDEPPEVRVDVLKRFLCVNNPSNRLHKSAWSVSCRGVNEGEYEYFVYECCKYPI